MADEVSVKTVGVEDCKMAFSNLSANVDASVKQALWNIAGKITMQAKNNCRSLFDHPLGRLMGSLTMASTWGKRTQPKSPAKSEDAVGNPADASGDSVVVGTNVVYARRIEFGFYGPDSLGRVYNQAPKSYLYPAFFANENSLLPEITKVCEKRRTFEYFKTISEAFDAGGITD